MEKKHQYRLQVEWTGNRGTGTSAYTAYDRSHTISVGGKAVILGSSDPAFRGEPSMHNPEELLVASLAACHMLWFLHLAAAAGVIVTAYRDAATGTMEETPDGGGRFTEVVLRAQVEIANGDDYPKLAGLHHAAHEKCFIAASVNFPVRVVPASQDHPGNDNRTQD